MQLKKFTQKDRYGNTMSYEFEGDTKPVDPTALMKAQMEQMQSVPPMQGPPPVMGEEFQMGNMATHPGEPRGDDTVPAWLTPGEFVVNAEATEMFGPQIEAMNEAGREVQQFKKGGEAKSWWERAWGENNYKPYGERYRNEGGDVPMPIAPPWTQTPEGLDDLLHEREGFRDHIYLDSLNKPTVGYGHLVADEEWEKDDPRIGTKPFGEEELMEMYNMDRDAAQREAVNNVGRDVWVGLSPEKQKVLSSMAFQLGGKGQRKFKKLLEAVKSGDDAAVAREALTGSKGGKSKWLKQTPKRALDLAEVFHPETAAMYRNAGGAVFDDDPMVQYREGGGWINAGKEFWNNYIGGPNAQFDLPTTGEMIPGEGGEMVPEIDIPYGWNVEAGRPYTEEEAIQAGIPVADLPASATAPSALDDITVAPVDQMVGMPDEPQMPPETTPDEEEIPAEEEGSNWYDWMLGPQWGGEEHQPLFPDFDWRGERLKEKQQKEAQEEAVRENEDAYIEAAYGGNREQYEKDETARRKAEREAAEAEKLKQSRERMADIFSRGDPDPDTLTINKDGTVSSTDPDTNEGLKLIDDAGKKDKKVQDEARNLFKELGLDSLFDKKELARMAVMYAGSRVLGNSHHGSINWAAKGYLNRIDAKEQGYAQLALSGKYTPESLKQFKKSGDYADLMPVGVAPNLTGEFKTFYGPNGQQVRAEKIKVGDNTFWSTDGKTRIDNSFHEDAGRVPGTQAYRDQIKADSKQYENMLDGLRSQFGTIRGGRDEADTYKTDLVPAVSGNKIAKWARDNNVPSEYMGTIVENAYQSAIAHSEATGKKVRDLGPYLREQFIISKVGDSSLFQGVDPVNVTKLLDSATASAALKGKKVTDTQVMQAYRTAWNDISTMSEAEFKAKYPDSPYRTQEQWNSHANDGENGFMKFVLADINASAAS